jgi:2-methylcitrate dehydratase PrpD
LTAAETIAAFARELTFEALPDALVERLQWQLLDTLGCGLAAHAQGAGTAVRDALLAAYGGGPASVIGSERGLPAPAAACANGALCHALDFDDTHAGAIVNVGAVLVPTVLATEGAARESLVALAAGAEVTVRLGLAAAPRFQDAGVHPTSVCGVIGAALAATRLEGGDPVHALGVAGSLASGLYEPLADGSSTKLLHAGWAAQAGLLAAAFARAGLDGPATVLEGERGLMRSFFGVEPDVVREHLDGLGERWECAATAPRPYPACNMLQSSIDATAAALGGRALRPSEIREIRVAVPGPAVPIVFATHRPRNPYDARFSLPYSVAAQVAHGVVDAGTYTEAALADADVLALAERVRYVAREFPTFPASYPCAVEIETAAGQTLAAGLEHHRGSRAFPMTVDELRGKLHRNAPAVAQTLEDAVFGLDLPAVRAAVSAPFPSDS